LLLCAAHETSRVVAGEALVHSTNAELADGARIARLIDLISEKARPAIFALCPIDSVHETFRVIAGRALVGAGVAEFADVAGVASIFIVVELLPSRADSACHGTLVESE
jgi:hypothetical protein